MGAGSSKKDLVQIGAWLGYIIFTFSPCSRFSLQHTTQVTLVFCSTRTKPSPKPTLLNYTNQPATASLDNTMSNNDSLILRIFAPFALGVPSRRHFVVLRRAKAHYQDVVQLGKDVVARQGPDFVLTDSEKGLISDKLFLIEQAIDELDKLTAARKAEIATGLQSLKDDFEFVQSILRG